MRQESVIQSIPEGAGNRSLFAFMHSRMSRVSPHGERITALLTIRPVKPMKTSQAKSKDINTHKHMKTKIIHTLSASSLAVLAAMLLVPQGMASDKDTLNAADVKFVKQEAAAGMAEVKIAQLAVTKAKRSDVRELAGTLVTDHTAVNGELTALAEKKGVELSTVIAPAHAATYQDLEKQSGAKFDKDFLAVIISDHKKCISNFEEASKEAKDADLKSWVDKTIPALKSHLDKAEALSAKTVTQR